MFECIVFVFLEVTGCYQICSLSNHRYTTGKNRGTHTPYLEARYAAAAAAAGAAAAVSAAHRAVFVAAAAVAAADDYLML